MTCSHKQVRVLTHMNLATNMLRASASVTDRATAELTDLVEGLQPGSPGVYFSQTALFCGSHNADSRRSRPVGLMAGMATKESTRAVASAVMACSQAAQA